MPIVRHRYTDYGKDFAEVDRFKITFKEVFVMEYLYKLMYEWLVDNGYASRDEYEFPEVSYLQKDNPVGKEIVIRWRLKKFPFGKKQKFWRFDLDVDMTVKKLKEVDIVWQGQKFKADKGEVEIEVAGLLVWDYAKEWESNDLIKLFKPLFMNFLWMKTKRMLYGDFFTELTDFQNAIKTYLKLETFIPEKERPAFYTKRVPE